MAALGCGAPGLAQGQQRGQYALATTATAITALVSFCTRVVVKSAANRAPSSPRRAPRHRRRDRNRHRDAGKHEVHRQAQATLANMMGKM